MLRPRVLRCLIIATFFLAGGRLPEVAAQERTDASAAMREAFPERKLLDDKAIGIGVIQVGRLRAWPVSGVLREFGVLQFVEQPLQELGIPFDTIERMMVVIDQETIDAAVSRAGAGTPEKAKGSEPQPMPFPTIVVTCVAPLDRKIVAEIPVLEELEGERIHDAAFFALWLSSDRAIVIGPAANVRRMVRAAKAKTSNMRPILDRIDLEADAAIAMDLESQARLFSRPGELLPESPWKGWLARAHILKPAEKPLLEIVATAANEETARSSVAIMELLLAQAKTAVTDTPPPVPIGMEKVAALRQKAINSTRLTCEGRDLILRVPAPPGFSDLADLLRPALQAQKDLKDRETRLKQIAIAFHNFLEVNGSFPGAGRGVKGTKGLSWRVHLLPYLDQKELYEEFHLDEPWDSPHNKELVEKMPDIYRSPNVEKPGYTSHHVFTGKGAPFADDRMPKFSEFLDGSWSTVLAVAAGPDKAEPWTKPGGLNFDPKTPLKALGRLDEPTFLIVLADGSFRHVVTSVDQATFRRMIQWQDGELFDLP